MPVLYPAPLEAGDRIAVTAPSSGVEPALHPRLELALQLLRDQGFVVEEGACLRAEVRGASACADDRAAELEGFLGRNDIAAIIPPWGGELAIQLLDRIEWPALAHGRPKWMLGYSDTSTLLVPITLHLNWATAHGPCLMDLVPGQDDALTRGVINALGSPPGAVLTQHQSQAWQSKWRDFAQDPAVTYVLDQPTAWRSLRSESKSKFSGRLIGGCLDTLVLIAASRHGRVPRFAAEHAPQGVILYLENAEQTPSAALRALQALRWAGWFDNLSGLMIGRNAAPDRAQPFGLGYAEALLEGLSDLRCPILVDVDIGHLPPQLLLINGALAHVEWSTTDGGTVTQCLV